MAFSFFFFIDMSRITSGRIKKKEGKYVFKPCRLRGGFATDPRGHSPTSCNKKVLCPKIHFTVSIKLQIFTIFYGSSAST